MTKKYESSPQGERHRPSGTSTKKKARRKPNDGLRPEYDFAAMRGGVRGKYSQRVRKSTNIVLLEPEIAKAFPTEEAVNGALRGLLDRRTSDPKNR